MISSSIGWSRENVLAGERGVRSGQKSRAKKKIQLDADNAVKVSHREQGHRRQKTTSDPAGPNRAYLARTMIKERGTYGSTQIIRQNIREKDLSYS